MTRTAAPGRYRSALAGPAARFSLVELELIAAYARASVPFPLRAPVFGRFPGEREVLFGVAGSTLRERGLADEDGPLGPADELAAALAGRAATVDLVLTGSGAPNGFAAIVHSGRSVLCHQRLDAAAPGPVGVRAVPLDELADVLVALIPPCPAARFLPVRVPAAAVQVVLHQRAGGTGGLGNQLYRIADRYGCSVDDLDALVRAGDTVTAGGRLGATVASAQGREVRADAELSWLDSAAGRLRITVEPGADPAWVSVNPLPPTELHAFAAGLVGTAARRRSG